ncbi:RDD family protein [Pseudomonas sp. F1_0610]|uniref:RDD family protein n=1 Tax=Pseudomonas sp. F1_0610 TaxID=3114284 RepID=UPI0039C3E90F
MSKNRHLLKPTGEYPIAGMGRRFAAMFYDFLLCLAIVMVATLIYQQGILRAIYGAEQLMAMSQAKQLDQDPVLYSILVFCLFGFFAKFWTHNGQTLGMQVWGVRVQNRDGTAIDLWQSLLRFFIAIFSWLAFGLGFWWMLFNKEKSTWHDKYSESIVVQLPKNAHKK